jgi:large subunit ribosomal protein L21
MGHKRGVKLINFKKKRRKGFSRRMGHRQELTVVKVKSVA